MIRTPVAVRPATAADHAAWLPLWRGYQAFYKVEQPEHETRITWQRLLDPAEPMHLALAERGGAVVGMVHFIEHPRAGAKRMQSICRTCSPRPRRAARAAAAR